MVELSTGLLAELGGWPALKEARGLIAAGRVREVIREGAVLRGKVQGAEKIDEPRITLGARVSEVEVRCTCVESRRHGRVCAHALAVGLAVLEPAAVASTPISKAGPKAMPPPRRWLSGEAPAGLPHFALTFLLPLDLEAALTRDAFRIILEASREGAPPAPWEASAADRQNGYAVEEEDEAALRALEAAAPVAGVNQLPRGKWEDVLRALDNHPRVWRGKKERIEIRAATVRAADSISVQPDGALAIASEVSLGWRLDGHALIEATRSTTRVLSRAEIPTFLVKEWPALERSGAMLPDERLGLRLETARPQFEARLEGALSGLTLKLLALYGGEALALTAPPSATTGYHPDPADLRRYWRRDLPAEAAALREVEAAGFNPGRGGQAFSLTQENKVARFLANTLPRWRRNWTVVYGARLKATLAEIDVAEPEYALRSSGENWLDLNLKLTVGGASVPLDPAEIQRWLQTGQSHLRRPDRRVLLVPTETWAEMREVLADSGVEQEPGRMRVPRLQAPFVTAALTAEGFRGAAMPDQPNPPVTKELDPGLAAILRPYQLQGVEWLAGLARRGGHGLLADDMGLGKTLQALAFTAWLRRTEPDIPPALVICPTSVVTNWLREAARFTPGLLTLEMTGPERASRWAERAQADLIVTSYAILRRDFELFRAQEYGLVVLDEAQHIKNRASQNAQAAKSLRARHRLILTGTPLENSVLDLWSLFDFLVPGYLGRAADFRERYETPLTRGADPRRMARLRHRVRPFLLRRTKEEVLTELPPKLEHLTLCELTDEQREVYRALLAQGRREIFELSGKAGRGRDRIAMLTALLRLRQASCHLDLLPASDPPRVWKEPSAKLERTFELIDEAIDGGHRVLLFSQFVRALHLLREEARRREVPFCYLDGQTLDRQAEVDRFQGDRGVPLFFISLKAGGTGLNLTGADTVIHFDPWWNPAVEAQATARAHRLGQANTVQAYKLIAAGTVEEKIQAMQARKRELFEASLGDETRAGSFSDDELAELLGE